ncbi:flagellar hook-associated protein 2 [Crenobacter luteus]|uniref:flagellar filament capping protein FliD n=1 Tax=Crenobacter luteus TaxID=1452487 RepID=UPI0010447FFF|nr:flagellar filament capping protein FliD [Crenobacter luteus]TCP15604.1 flagellar hook-associated protein 2 [Crenobacter luteus]
MAEINPTQIATQLASLYVQKSQQQLTTQNKAAKARSDALNQLQKALQDFRSTLSGLGAKKTLAAMSASFGQDGAGTVSASGTAQPGSYALFVEKLATAHQIAVDGATATAGGTLTIGLAGGGSFDVDLAAADRDGDGSLSAAEIARAVNRAPDNGGKVNAMVLTADGQTRLVFASANTGAAGQITLDASQVADAGLQAALGTPTQLSAAADAVVWLGGKDSGVKMQQASNTFTAIDGVTMTFTRAMQDGDAPLTLTVARNANDTAANVQSFVDAYNGLLKTLDTLSAAGGTDKSAGPFASDSGVRALRDRLNTMIRQRFGGVSLAEMGVTASRQGTLSLDRAKLDKLMADKPTALDDFFNGAGANGLLKEVGGYLDKWLNGSSGLIKQRRDSAQRMQGELDARQARIDNQYDQAYKRYLAQYSQLQAMQAQMSQTLDTLNGYFAQQ